LDSLLYYRKRNLSIPGLEIAKKTLLLHPTLRANPCPEVTDLFCRLPLTTFVYRLEATHLGDLMRFWVRPSSRVKSSPGFSRADRDTPDDTRWCHFSAHPTISPDNPIPWIEAFLNRKENSPQSLYRRPRVHLRYRVHSVFWYGNINPFPFRWIAFYTLLSRNYPIS
jgi:hypothetical protein